jgi:D-glycero-alpha-D-manno-heptose 1-phosphate guanylyltransferase
MITEAIVLAGGLGTRLQSEVPDLPKSLVPIAGKPFLAYLLDYAKKQGIGKFIFALGHKSSAIESFVKQYLPEGSYVFSVEGEPLGTGGAVYQACEKVSTPNVIVLNADTYFGISFLNLSIIHEPRKAACTIALKPMNSANRYGSVDVYKQVITGFSEKRQNSSGLINGGVYALSIPSFSQKSFPRSFSFEKDYLEKEVSTHQILGMVSDAYFIDIGIPEEYQRAQTELVSVVKERS